MPESTTTFNSDTLFQACSISKAITALAVIKLCQEGRLDLDAPISQYLSPEQLSWLSTFKTRDLVSHISLRLLLSHTSGLCVHGFRGYSKDPIPTLPQILRGDPPANNECISLFTLPGQMFAYSGGGYTVIQLILETQLQKPFHQIMDEIVLQPLKMARSTYQFLPADEKNYAPVYLTGKNKSVPDHHFLPESAAAGLWTTPSDLLRVIQAVQQSLESDGFLERKWAEIMLTEVGDNGMALGWMTKKGGVHFEHPGSNDPGYYCVVVGYATLGQPKTDGDQKSEDLKKNKNSIPKECGICVMTSSALGDVVMDKILAAVPYLQGWPSVQEKPMAIFMDRARGIDVQAKHWCGKWGPGEWYIDDENGMSVRYGSLPAVPLVPAALPPHKYEEGESIDLLADGLELMLRLGWKDGARSVEVWQCCELTTLDKSDMHLPGNRID